ncbi:MAG TPA: tetratricopeptide repeat protein, partial [Treponemataceae bacterium]|nr:tetratricopeptide repeat protein [Treponemataceae bacterium]
MHRIDELVAAKDSPVSRTERLSSWREELNDLESILGVDSGALVMPLSMIVYLSYQDNDQRRFSGDADRYVSLISSNFDSVYASLNDAYLLIGNVLCGGGGVEEAKIWYEKALEQTKREYDALVGRKAEIPERYALLCARLGDQYGKLGKYELSIDCLLEAIACQSALTGGESLPVAELHKQTGDAFYESGNISAAIAQHEAALALFERNNAEGNIVKLVLQSLVLDYGKSGLGAMNERRNRDAIAAFKNELAVWQRLSGSGREESATVCDFIGSLYNEEGSFAESIEFYQRAVAIRMALDGNNDRRTGNTLALLAVLYGTMGDTLKQSEAMETRLSLLKENPVGNAVELYRLSRELAGIYAKQNRFVDAASLYDEAFIFGKSAGDVPVVELANVRVAEGLALVSGARFDRARDCFTYALAERRKQYGDASPSVATVYTCLGSLELRALHSAESEKNMLVAIAILEPLNRKGDLDLATLYSNMSCLCSQCERLPEARRWMDRAVAIVPDCQNLSDERIYSIYCNRAQISVAECHYQDGIDWYMKVIAATTSLGSVGGDVADQIAIAYNGIALSYYYLGDYEKAMYYYKNALSFVPVLNQLDKPFLLKLYSNVAMLYMDSRGSDEAVRYFHEALRIAEEVYPEPNADVALLNGNLGALYSRMGDKEKANAQILHALDLLRSIGAEYSREGARLYYSLSTIALETKRTDDARSFLEQALAIYQTIGMPSDSDVLNLYTNAFLIYSGSGD